MFIISNSIAFNLLYLLYINTNLLLTLLIQLTYCIAQGFTSNIRFGVEAEVALPSVMLQWTYIMVSTTFFIFKRKQIFLTQQ